MKIIEIKPNMVKVVIGVDLKDFDEIKQILIASLVVTMRTVMQKVIILLMDVFSEKIVTQSLKKKPRKCFASSKLRSWL